MSDLNIRVELPPKLVPVFANPEADVRYAFGGRGSAKTRSFAMMALVYALRFANAGISGQILCARQFMNSLDESSLEELKRAAQSDPRITPLFEVGDRYIRTACKRVSFSFAGLDRNIASIKSKGRILLCWIDEAEPVTDEAFNTLIPTLREEGNGWSAELWVTWNPKRKAAPVEARFRNSTDPRYVGTELNWRDNPRFPEILERQRQRDMVERPESYDHIWEGAYIQAVQGAYYARDLTKARIEGRIGKVAADPILPLKAFVDIGGTGAKADAFAMWIAQFVGKEIRMLDYYEVVGQPLAAHLEWLRGKNYTPAQCQIWLPHDGAMHDRVYSVTYESAFMSAGYRVDVMPNQGAGAAKARIEAMRRCFPQMWFNAETTQPGIDALGWYHEKWDENRGIGLGPAHDWSSHACLVAGTLIDTETGLVPIERVVAGMRVKTPAGLALVQWAGQTGEASEIVTLEGGNGQTLQCTPSHKIFTTSGVVYADAVGHNSAFITLENAPCLKSASVKSMGYRDAFIESIGASSIGIGKTTKSMPASGAAKFLSCIGSWPRAKARAHIADPLMAIGRTLTLIIGNSLSACMPKSCTSMSFKFSMANATTSGQMGILPCESTEPPSSCTGQFGNITTAKQFPQTTTFTTSMGTKATTALRTWSFFRPQTTQSTMQKPVLGWAVRVQSKHGARLNWPQWLGIKAPRAGNGIANTPRTLGLVFSLKRTMQSVFNAARNTKPLHPSGQCSAPVIVRAQTTIGKPRPVYDLTIEHHHCYFANGFLVSNCDSAGLLALAYEAQQNQRTGPATPIRRNLKGVV